MRCHAPARRARRTQRDTDWGCPSTPQRTSTKGPYGLHCNNGKGSWVVLVHFDFKGHAFTAHSTRALDQKFLIFGTALSCYLRAAAAGRRSSKLCPTTLYSGLDLVTTCDPLAIAGSCTPSDQISPRFCAKVRAWLTLQSWHCLRPVRCSPRKTISY